MNTKKTNENCNYKFDMFLEQRNFVIPQSAVRMSKVDSSRKGTYIKPIKVADSESPLKTTESFVEPTSGKLRNGNEKKQLESQHKADRSSLGKENNGSKSINMAEKLPNKQYALPTMTSVALAHSVSTVSPMKDMQLSQFCQNVQNSMKSLNFHNILPTQSFSWPHLMQQSSNSLLLIDNPNSGRTWCYLPALCSLVIRRMQSSRTRLGPVAILLADLDSITKLANDCATLMQKYNTKFLKVVQTCAYSHTDLCTALLDSCGILITSLDTLRKLLEIHYKNDLKLFDSNYLEFFVCDDYDLLRISSPELLNKVLQQCRSIFKYRLRLILVSQQWHRKVFPKLIKDLADNPLILFGDFLEAAIYGGLKLKTVLQRTNGKLRQLLKYIEQHESKRTLIYCQNQQELHYLTTELTKIGRQCIGISEAENQQPHQLLLASDESPHSDQLVKKNVEVLVHFSMPKCWSKFVFRFHSMMDNITNLLVFSPNPVNVVTLLMLDESNYHELLRLVKYFDSHGIAVDKCLRQAIVSCQQEVEKIRPFCPYLLSSGKCDQKQQCNKRHHFVRSDVQRPQKPMEQSGTIVRCNVHKVYDPVHMAVWPIEYKPPGSSMWLPAPTSVSQFSMALALSMAIKSQPHLSVKAGDVCVVNQQGQFKRVRVVDVSHRHPVTVQLMDLGTELLKVDPTELLECEQKLQVAPPLAMDVRLTQIQPAGGKSAVWSSEATKWVTNSLKGLSEQQHIQLIVDFAMLDVVYASEVAVVEKCHTMRTSVYKLKLRKELLLKGYGQLQENVDQIQLGKYLERELNSKTNKVLGSQEKEQDKEPLSNENEAKSETKVPCNSRNMSRLSQLMAAINNFLQKIDSPVESMPEQKGLLKKSHEEPIAVETSVMDSTTQFLNTLIGQLNKEDSSVKRNSAQQLINNLFGEDTPISAKVKIEHELENTNNNTSPVPAHAATYKIKDALKCAATVDGTVCPKVKWKQTPYQIDITFEQQVPQYTLFHRESTIIYSAAEAVPPQRCVLNLLGEVKILSEQQHGYILHVKLAKLSLLSYWPTLLNSLNDQKHFHWLNYDTKSTKPLPRPMGLALWHRYVRRQHQSNTTEDGEDQDGVSSSWDNQFEAGVEQCKSLITDVYEDF